MKKAILFAVLALTLSVAPVCADNSCKATYGQGDMFSLATGSPGELGLLKELADAFRKEHGVGMCWKKAGSGASLKLLKAGNVDVVMVHAPSAEKQAVADGWARKRTLIGSNEFYIVGPPEDPAGVALAASAAGAFARIGQAKALFFSRGDNSGTHKKELFIWKNSGIEPRGDWYKTTKDFMMATLLRADREEGYFMTDSSTYVAAKAKLKNIKVLFRGDPVLINTYHALAAMPGATAKSEAGSEFIKFVASKQGQKIIRNYGKGQYGGAMYNDAEYAKQYDH